MDLERTAGEPRAVARQIRAEMQDNRPGLMSVKTAAAYLGVSEWTVRKMITDGTVTHLRIGHRILIPRSSADSLGEAQRFLAEEEPPGNSRGS